MELPLDSLRFGPVHVNMQFGEPLLPDEVTDWLDEIKVSPLSLNSVKITTLKAQGVVAF